MRGKEPMKSALKLVYGDDIPWESVVTCSRKIPCSSSESSCR